MSKNNVIDNFFTGTGFFAGDIVAWQEARMVTKNQRRQWERYGIIPSSFFFYLARIGVLEKKDIPKRPITLGVLLDMLRLYSYPDEQARSHGIYIFRAILEAEIPRPEYSALIGLGDHVWQTLRKP